MSIHISDKTLQDLEFSTVLEQISTFSISDLGKKQTLEITPFLNKKMVVDELAYTNEYLSSFESDNRIPNHGFDNINDQIKEIRKVKSKKYMVGAAVGASEKEFKRDRPALRVSIKDWIRGTRACFVQFKLS